MFLIGFTNQVQKLREIISRSILRSMFLKPCVMFLPGERNHAMTKSANLTLSPVILDFCRIYDVINCIFTSQMGFISRDRILEPFDMSVTRSMTRLTGDSKVRHFRLDLDTVNVWPRMCRVTADARIVPSANFLVTNMMPWPEKCRTSRYPFLLFDAVRERK